MLANASSLYKQHKRVGTTSNLNIKKKTKKKKQKEARIMFKTNKNNK